MTVKVGAVVGCVCGGGGGGWRETGIINTRNNIRYDIRLSIYSDKMGPEEMERRLVVEKKKQMHHIYLTLLSN